MIITMFGIGMSRWVKMTLLAAAVSACTTATAVAQALPGAPIVDSVGVPPADENALELGPGEMLLNPEMIPPELRPKFPPAPVPGDPATGPNHLCPHCGTPGCGGACAVGGVGVGEGIPCGGCAPGYVARFDALYMTNENIEGFDYEWGGRASLRRQFDCVNGYEFVYATVPEWDYVIGGDAAYEAQYHSFEANRTYNGWDVANALHGIRVIQYEEEVTDIDGLLPNSEVENLLIGLQAGLDLDYPLSRRLWSTIRTRGGVFANFADGSDGSDDEAIAGLLELGSGLRYDLGPALSIYGGYELWYLANVASVHPSPATPVDIEDEIFMHGLTFGAQLRF